MPNDLRAFVAELVGTFLVVFVGAGAVCALHLAPALADRTGNPDLTLQALGILQVAVASGLILAVALSISLPISGGYLNPAVTIALWMFKRIESRPAVWLIAAQLLGALAAGGLVRAVFPDRVLGLDTVRLGTPHFHFEMFPPETSLFVKLLAGALVEVILTFLLTFAIFGLTIDPRRPGFGAFGVGLALAAGMLVGYPLTGGAMNPARWFGPVAWEATLPRGGGDAFSDAFVYAIGPVVGAVLAAWLYLGVLLPAEPEKK